MKKIARRIEFHHEGKVYHRSVDGVWSMDTKGKERLSADEAARIEAACKVKMAEKEEWGKKAAAAIQAAQRATLHPYLDYLNEVERAELAEDRRLGLGDGKPCPDEIEPADAYHETGAGGLG